MRVLAFGAHPDDIEEHTGGTLAKYRARGDEVYMCVATDGQIGSYKHTRDEIKAIRRVEAQNAADTIGAHLIWLGYEDEMIFDDRETRMRFIDVVREARPDIIFAPPKGMRDYNQDHDITGYLAWEARILATVKLMETDHPVIDHIPPLFFMTAWGGMATATNPQYFVDITREIDTKMKMFKCHASQEEDWGGDAFGTKYSDNVLREGSFYGSACGTAGVQYVEAFTLCTDWPIIADAYKLLP